MYGQVPGNERFTGNDDLGRTGNPKRVFFVSMESEASTAGVLYLKDGTSTGADTFATLIGNAGSGNIFDLGGNGIRFPNGCFVQVGRTSGVTYAVIVYQEEQ